MDNNNLKFNPKFLAKRDISVAIEWAADNLKPGEKVILSEYKNAKRDIEKIVIEMQDNKKMVEIATAKAVNGSQSNKEISRLQQDKLSLENEIERLKKIQITNEDVKEELIAQKSFIEVNNSELLNNKNDEILTLPKSKWYHNKIFRDFLPIFLVIIFSLFDGYNTYIQLGNYNNNRVYHIFFALIIFVGVLYTSINTKKTTSKKGMIIMWTGFIFFLSVANIVQFLGKDKSELYGVQNLISSPERLMQFVISFFGSIIVTVIYVISIQKKETIKEVKNDENSEEVNTYNSICNKLKDIDNITTEISEKEKQKVKISEAIDVERKNIQDENYVATSQAKKQAERIDNLLMQCENLLENLPDSLSQDIDIYRNEIKLSQLLNNYPKSIKFIDKNLITL